MKWRRILVLGFTVGASAGLATLLTRSGRPGAWAEALEFRTLDWRTMSRPERGKEDEGYKDVVIVFLDSAATREWPYLSPYPRAMLADVIETVAGAGARVIGLDVYLDRLYPELNRMDAGDDRLREAIAAARNVVLVAPVQRSGDSVKLAYPDPFFAEVALDVGAAEIPTPFETIRDAVIAVRSENELEPSFALALYAHAQGIAVDSLLRAALETRRIELPGLPEEFGRIPAGWFTPGAETHGYAVSFPLKFLGPPSVPGDTVVGTFKAYTADDVPVAAAFGPEWFRDKIVLIGSGFHETERFRSPFYDYIRPDGAIAGWTYGVEVHANTLVNFLRSEYLKPFGRRNELLLMLGLSALVGTIVFWRGAVWGGATLALAGAALWWFAISLFVGEWQFALGHQKWTLLTLDRADVWVPLVTPSLALLLSYLGSVGYVSIVEGKEKRFIRRAFSKYVSPQVVSDIAANPGALRLGGEKRELTLLFSDLAGFTTLSESMDPEHLVSLLNEYLDEMASIVLDEHGTLDKYIGDAIMAFWNAPREQDDHADRALRCAIRMQRRLAELNRRWLEQGRAAGSLQVRIGVNTGIVIVGNVGGTERFDYSAIGDAVNLAARLEPANKTYGTLIMASEFTIRLARFERYRMRQLDCLAVKGKTEPVRVYEIIGFADEPIEPAFAEALQLYNQGLTAYQGRDWKLAEHYFAAALQVKPQDGPSRLYLERARECAVNPPPADWDFVVRRTVK